LAVQLVLWGHSDEQYFPKPVKQLVWFLYQYPVFWAPVFHYLRGTKPDDDPPRRAWRLERAIKIFHRAREMPTQAKQQLRDLLEAVYTVKRKGKDPRGLIVEYIVWSAKAFAPDPGTAACKRMKCDVRIKDGNTSRRLVDSDANFDAAWLSASHFFGAECKVSVKNFTIGRQGITDRALRKYTFMSETHRRLTALGRSSRICVVGCDADIDLVRAAINSAGFQVLEVLGADQLEALLTQDAGTCHR